MNSFEIAQLRAARWNNRITALSALIALAGLYFLWHTIRDSEQANIDTRRAWLAVRTVGYLDGKPPMRLGDEIRLFVPYRNLGPEPARNVELFAEPIIIKRTGLEQQIADLPIPKNDSCDKLKEADSISIVWPAGDQRQEEADYSITVREGNDVPQKFDQDFVDGKSVLGVHGCVHYETYGKPHITKFCFYYQPTTFGNRTAVSWGYCPGKDQIFAD